jgi:hypothetical protein
MTPVRADTAATGAGQPGAVAECDVCLIRVAQTRDTTYEAWCAANGYPVDDTHAAVVGTLSLAFGPSTAAARGKAKGMLRKHLTQEERRRRYETDVPIRYVTEHVQRRGEHDEAFEARLRVLNRREARRLAAMEARPVQLELFAGAA